MGEVVRSKKIKLEVFFMRECLFSAVVTWRCYSVS